MIRIDGIARVTERLMKLAKQRASERRKPSVRLRKPRVRVGVVRRVLAAR
jgi:hypothetical protein